MAALPLMLVVRFGAATAAEVVIGNPKLKIDTLTRQQVNSLFLRKVEQLPDGTKIIVFDHKDDEPIKQEFYRKVADMSPGQLRAYWAAKMHLVPKTFPPLAYHGDQAVKRLVSNTPGGMGYIEEGSVDSSVKVLFKP